jgi:hypothetical protein
MDSPSLEVPAITPDDDVESVITSATAAVAQLTGTQPVSSTPTTATSNHSLDTPMTGPAGSQPLVPARPKSGKAIIKVAAKVGSALPTFSAPPIDEVVLNNLYDADLVSVAKTACSIHTQAGAYAREFLAELKRRFEESKKLRKPYLGYKNFDNLCADKLEVSARQVRNILNNNPGGRKGRVLKPRPSVKELDAVKAENKRLKAHAKLVEDANDRVTKASAQPAAGYTQQGLERAKRDAIRDYQKIAVNEKQEAENEIAALKNTVGKLTSECRRLQKQPKRAAGKSATLRSKPPFASSRSPIDDSETPSKEEAARHVVCLTLSVIKRFPRVEKHWIVDEVVARLRDASALDASGAPEASRRHYDFLTTLGA